MSAPDIDASTNSPLYPDDGLDRAATLAARAHVSPRRRWWLRFKRHRLGYWSLVVFVTLYSLGLAAELLSNDRPLIVYFEGHWFFPMLFDYPETVFGGPMPIFTDYLDPFIRAQFQKAGNFALYPPNHFNFDTLSYYTSGAHHPGAPSADNWLGTDISGYDITALLLHGFRISVSFALGLTIVGTVLGILIGAVQGFFAGKVDLFAQRIIEVWGSMPELYLLIIFASLFQQTFALLFLLMTLFAWVHIADYVRAEFLRNRQLEYVKAARALGLPSWQIMWRHVLPNSLTPVITLLPFRMSAGITALASLDFLGLGVSDAPSLGRLLLQGKENLDAWWISVSSFGVLVSTMLLLTFIGEALRSALDTRVVEGEAGAS